MKAQTIKELTDTVVSSLKQLENFDELHDLLALSNMAEALGKFHTSVDDFNHKYVNSYYKTAKEWSEYLSESDKLKFYEISIGKFNMLARSHHENSYRYSCIHSSDDIDQSHIDEIRNTDYTPNDINIFEDLFNCTLRGIMYNNKSRKHKNECKYLLDFKNYCIFDVSKFDSAFNCQPKIGIDSDRKILKVKYEYSSYSQITRETTHYDTTEFTFCLKTNKLIKADYENFENKRYF